MAGESSDWPKHERLNPASKVETGVVRSPMARHGLRATMSNCARRGFQ